ncbi:MAG TPA: hypothetical protein VHV51_06350 [Polyangiaceae bacterium]|jgi:hypothetical protein|nr:hypothetical protein [Polyangiaceae bacterium]
MLSSVAVALALCPALARAQTEHAPEKTTTHVVSEFPKQLAITIVARENMVPTFRDRVASWFTDGTEVSVIVTSEVDQDQILSSSPSEVRAWVIPLSAERALVTFSCATPKAGARHLVRQVRLRDGLDDLGLERLASVIHSAFVALGEGTEGIERAEAERALGAAGLSPATRTPPAEFAPKTPAPKPVASALPDAPAARNPNPNQKPKRVESASLLVGAGYGLRLRGEEGFAHGPTLALGVQLPTARTPVDLLLSGQVLFRSSFDAELFDASVQTTALRVHAGIEPRFAANFFGVAWIGAGVDVAQIHASVGGASQSNVDVNSSGTQWRGAGELTLGVLERTNLLDIAVYAQLVFLLEDVRYSATTSSGEERLVTPWPIEPGLSLQCRFRGAL